ncbi:NAD(P)/FAD-dependent oxidoreductase [Niallia sp. 01092]|uniref:NAD(P)/FAD-dependent oxidoreductase n=1 Tax=unclassified Niallia TaxID=2837522 RepID=UPI003FD079A5
MKKYDVIIVGGGIMASSVAYNLRKDGFTGSIAIFEKDQMYEFSSTPRSEGGIRLSFTTEVNIQLSHTSLEFYKKFEKEMEIDGETPLLDFKQDGYLYLATNETLPKYIDNAKFQNKLGANIEVLSVNDIKKIIPELNVDDLAGGAIDRDAGTMDPYTVLQFYVKQAKSLGVECIYEPVQSILSENGKVTGVKVESGEEYQAPVVVNACGAWAGVISSTIGIEIPVRPLRYQIYSFDLATQFEKTLPSITFDPSGVYFRKEGAKISSGMPHRNPDGFEFTSEKSGFEEQIWPVLAERSQIFEQLKLERGWVGLYDFNHIDHNAIIGGHPDMKGYYMITGFSGHGFQQAPAAGKGLAELIRLGKYETIDLSSLSIERFAKKQLILETAVL